MVLSATDVRATIPLNDRWLFALDRADVGVQERWFAHELSETIIVPGSWEEQGFGDMPTSHPLGGWSKHYVYEGAAWYSRRVEIPADWDSKSILLMLKGVRWRSEVWLDEQYIGVQESLSTPHKYDLTTFIKPGSTQRLALRIDNHLIYPLKESHINSEHTATRWGGISGGAELIALPTQHIERIVCRPNVAERRFDFEVYADDGLTADVTVTQPETGMTYNATGLVQNGKAALSVELGRDAHLWWDDDPFLYQANFTLHSGETFLDTLQKRVGLREITVEGRNILLNGQPVFLRGYVDCCIFPLTGYPTWDVDHYRHQFAVAKSYGFNHVRLHSWTPSEPFWDAADEAGMLVQTELPHWSRAYDFAEVAPPADLHAFLVSEFERIIPALNLHPSWVMFSNGNELLGNPDGHPLLTALVERGKTLDATRLYTDNTGFGQMPAPSRSVDYYIQSCNWHPPMKIYDAASNDTTQDFSAITALADGPVIGHEHGQFTMYARPQEAAKFTGVISPSYFESVIETFDAKNITARVGNYIQASGIHVVRTYKENIERARRTRDLVGFQLLDIRDFPGQGHATTGILDVFWDSKGLIEPERFAEFNGAITLLMRAPSPTFWNGTEVAVELEISNFGHRDIPAGSLNWELRSATTTLSGQLTVPSASAGKLTALGRLEISIPADGVAAHTWELVVSFSGATNRWHVWSYPYPQLSEHASDISSRLSQLRGALPGANYSDDFTGIGIFTEGKLPSAKLAISERLTGRVLQYLYDGGSVWLMPAGKHLHSSVPTRYLPPFWSYLWFPDNVSNVMGMLIPDHPALANFPHDSYSDWQWYSLVNETPAICLDEVPFIEPVVEVVDNFNRAKRLAYAFEAHVGKGRLFVSTWRLTDPAVAVRPEARFLFSEITRYLLGEQFVPTQALSVGQLLGIFKLSNGQTFNFE